MTKLGTRRGFMRTAGLAATGVAAHSAVSGLHNPAQAHGAVWDYDLTNPEDAVKAYSKMAGSLVEQEVYMEYHGEIFSIAGRSIAVPLLRLKGLLRQRWTPNGDGTYSYSNYDHGLFCDFETGEVIDKFENPLTGETNDVLHYKSGPLERTVGTGEGHDNPLNKRWNVIGRQISLQETRTTAFKNPVSPERWGRASTGERLPLLISATYIADALEMADPHLSTIDADHIWTFVVGYPAWMLMGDFEGQVMWRWVARKFSDRSKIDPLILGEINDRVPNFLDVDKPWPERSDGWTQYTRERQPPE